MKYSAMEMKCDSCQKTIKGQTEIYYNMNVDRDRNVTFEWICDSCFSKWLKSWETKELLSYQSEGYIGGALFKVKMADGRVLDGTFSTIVNTPTTNFKDAPDSFAEEIHEHIKKWKVKQASAEEVAKRNTLISDIKFAEGWDMSVFSLVTYGGLRLENVKFKVSAGGQLWIDPLATIPEFLLPQIQEKFEIYKQGMV